MSLTRINEVKCSICNGHIKPLRNREGKIVWRGNNAKPINDGICCDDCDLRVVIPARQVR